MPPKLILTLFNPASANRRNFRPSKKCCVWCNMTSGGSVSELRRQGIFGGNDPCIWSSYAVYNWPMKHEEFWQHKMERHQELQLEILWSQTVEWEECTSLYMHLIIKVFLICEFWKELWKFHFLKFNAIIYGEIFPIHWLYYMHTETWICDRTNDINMTLLTYSLTVMSYKKLDPFYHWYKLSLLILFRI
jgi:hypothetical protein